MRPLAWFIPFFLISFASASAVEKPVMVDSSAPAAAQPTAGRAPTPSLKEWDKRNPRYQEMRKIQKRLEDFLTDRLKTHGQLLFVRIKAGDNSELYFEVDALLADDPAALGKNCLPDDFENFAVRYSFLFSGKRAVIRSPCPEHAEDPVLQALYQAQERLEAFLCSHPELKKHILGALSGYDEKQEESITVEIGRGWLKHAKKFIPREFEGIPVKLRESHLEARPPNSLCMRRLEAWLSDVKNTRTQEVREIQRSFEESFCGNAKITQHILIYELKVDWQGEPLLWVGVRQGWLQEAQAQLPRRFKGIPVEIQELDRQSSSHRPFCSRHLVTWMHDGNPRFEEVKKIQARFSDYLDTRLEPIKELITLGTRGDDQGEPYFEVGINLKRFEVIEEKQLPREWEGIPVKYHRSGELKKLIK